MTQYFAEMIVQIADYELLEVGQTVRSCFEHIERANPYAIVMWGWLESEPGLLSHVVTESCLETAEKYLRKRSIT